MQYSYRETTVTVCGQSNMEHRNRSSGKKCLFSFFPDVLLTVHLSIFTSVINQLDSQILVL